MDKIRKLSRRQIEQGLDQIPVSEILGASVARELTPKQRAFARDVAKGKTKASAYRDNYNVKSRHTMSSKPYHLSNDDRVKAEIDAYKAAIEAEQHRTPAALRALVIQKLVETITDPDTPPAVRVQALKVTGQITEVSAFTERREVKTISSSDDARKTVMNQIRELMKASATDATIIEHEADSLLKELAGDATHPPGTPQTGEQEAHASLHTIPPERSQDKSISPRISQVTLFPTSDPTPSDWEDPPVIDSGKSA